MNRERVRHYLFLCGGFLFTGLGVAGVLLPLIPGTPFLILAAYCFSQSSETFHNWLIHHKYLGPPIQDWERNRAIRPATKAVAAITMLVGSVLILPHEQIPLAAKAIYAAAILIGLGYVLSRPNQ